MCAHKAFIRTLCYCNGYVCLKTRSRSDFTTILFSMAWYITKVSEKACIHFIALGFQIENEMFI